MGNKKGRVSLKQAILVFEYESLRTNEQIWGSEAFAGLFELADNAFLDHRPYCR